MKRRIRIAILVMGFSGLVAEILLLRELMIVFSGNELCIGIILANWLIIEALGCHFPGKLIDRIKNKLEAFSIITVLFSIAFVVAVVLTRNLKNMLGVSIGENVGLLPIFYSSFLILLPVSMLHGALFTFSCRIFAMSSAEDASSAGKVYVYETAGTIAGGVAGTFLLIPYFNTVQVTIGIAFLNVLSCLYLLLPYRHRGYYQKSLLSVLGILLLFFGYMLPGGQADALQEYSIGRQWKNHQVVHYENSPYGNICVLDNEGQYIFFEDGVPTIITPVPDMIFVEEFVHLPLLAHPDPSDIFILRGGAGGVINEALKHPGIQTIKYAEQDPLLLELIRKFPTPLTESELNDERVTIRHIDGRLLLSTTENTYDVIFVGIMEPLNLQANRFFTREFFSLAKKRLNEGGILVMGVPGSLTYTSEELRNLNSSIYHTLKSVFSNIRVIPGEKKNLFLSSDAGEIMKADLKRVIHRLEERNIASETMVPWHIEKKLHDGWQQWFSDFIEGRSDRINHDFKPLGLFYNITHWNALHAPDFGSWFKQLERLRVIHIIPVLLLIGGLHFLVRKKIKHYPRVGVPFSIFTTGIAGMVFSLVVIFMFQMILGHVFSWIGLLVAFFMTGVAAGAMLITKCLPEIKNGKRLFLKIEGAIIGFCVALPFIFKAFYIFSDTHEAFHVFRILFLVISLMSGILVGSQYPLANKLQLKEPESVSKTAGSLFALDLLGGWLGGIAAGVVLLPVLGLYGTCIIAGLLKITSFTIVASEPIG